jgi:putative Mn2+ efflux pump MntP
LLSLVFVCTSKRIFDSGNDFCPVIDKKYDYGLLEYIGVLCKFGGSAKRSLLSYCPKTVKKCYGTDIMSFLEIVLLAIGLSMDAFAVSITLGLSVQKPKIIQYLIPGLYFGFFQALMPFTGFHAGTLFAEKIQSFEHWVVFIVLGFIGGKMIKDSFSKEEEKAKENPFNFIKMLLLAIATSIDALAVGVTFAFFKINIFIAILIIGFTTFLLSTAGVKIGNIFGVKYKSKAEFVGGAVLVILGIKFLIEGLFFK